MGKSASEHISVSEQERRRIASFIEEQVRAARDNHEQRCERFRRYYRMWRGLIQTRGNRNDGKPFQYPMLKWIVFGQWARVMQALLGDDKEVIAKAASPMEDKQTRKTGAYMTWRFFEYMEATITLSTWVFRALIFGRGHAEILYEMETYWERATAEEMTEEKWTELEENKLGEMALQYIENKDGSVDYECLSYDGPRMRGLWPSQLILPAQDNVVSDDDFEWKCRRDRVTPEQLLVEERRGRAVGITDNWNKITANAEERMERDYLWDNEQLDRDEAEGVMHASLMGNRDSLERWRWYGKWRFLKGKSEGGRNNLEKREMYEKEIVVTYLPDCQLVIGIEDLRAKYPRMKKRDPIVSLGGVKDGSYWTPGLGELVEELQNEASVNYSVFRKAGMLSVGPILFFKPSSGFDPDTFEYKPGQAIPSEDPSGVKTIEMKADLAFPTMLEQILKSLAELTTGVSDQTLGRVSDRPNAPQTASGQAMLIQEGNTRVSLDMNMLREDIGRALNYVWQLDREYSSPEVYFQVTGDDAPFDVNHGFGKMTSEERNHPYTFSMKFATSFWSREAKKQALIQIYGLSMQNPIVATNPRALWVLLNRIWEAYGEPDFKDIIPEPPNPEVPKTAKQEWALMLKGDLVDVSPLDQDDIHLIDHRRRLAQAIQQPSERRDRAFEAGVLQHIIQHEHQKRQKVLLQAVANLAVQQMQQSGMLPQGDMMQPAPLPDGLNPAAAPPAPGPGMAIAPAEGGPPA